MAGSSGSTSGDRDHNGGTYDDLGSRRCAGGTDPEYFGYTVCRTGSCIFVVTILLLVFTRPFAMRFINTRRLKTNYEGIIGKTIRISQKVDNIGQTGMAVVNGTEWTVRSEQDDVILEPGTLAKVVNISGVKLIVKI